MSLVPLVPLVLPLVCSFHSTSRSHLFSPPLHISCSYLSFNQDEQFVEERRIKLQQYLRQLLNFLTQCTGYELAHAHPITKGIEIRVVCFAFLVHTHGAGSLCIALFDLFLDSPSLPPTVPPLPLALPSLLIPSPLPLALSKCTRTHAHAHTLTLTQ